MGEADGLTQRTGRTGKVDKTGNADGQRWVGSLGRHTDVRGTDGVSE